VTALPKLFNPPCEVKDLSDAGGHVDCCLKEWAYQFLALWKALYAEETKDDHQGDDPRIVPTGLKVIRLPIDQIVHWFLVLSGLRRAPVSQTRNEQIQLRYLAGEALSDLVNPLR
jgi:hypothetical protein